MSTTPEGDPTTAAGVRATVAGSAPGRAAGATRAVGAAQQTTVTVYLRGVDPPEGARVTREEWAASFGASDGDVAAISSFASEAGLTVESVDQARRAVVLSGPVAALAVAFGVEVRVDDSSSGGTRLVPSGPISVPVALEAAVTAVVGFDERPQARTRLRRRHAASPPGFTPIQVAQAYAFPPGTDGTGQTVALIELGGGYREADLQAYFAGLGTPVPTVTAVGVDGATNAPTQANGPRR